MTREASTVSTRPQFIYNGFQKRAQGFDSGVSRVAGVDLLFPLFVAYVVSNCITNKGVGVDPVGAVLP